MCLGCCRAPGTVAGNGRRAVGITSHTLYGNGFAARAFPKATERSRDTMRVEGRRDSGFDASLDSSWLSVRAAPVSSWGRRDGSGDEPLAPQV